MTEPRRYALGVDTGGTYTDAVVYDERAREIVAKAKSPTTHDELAIGIGRAIDAAVSDAAVDPSAIEMVALSTTLATNALVEGTGRPACLVTIGFDEDALDRGGLREAIGDDAVIVVGHPCGKSVRARSCCRVVCGSTGRKVRVFCQRAEESGSSRD